MRLAGFGLYLRQTQPKAEPVRGRNRLKPEISLEGQTQHEAAIDALQLLERALEPGVPPD
jgi:hypothetical protein